MNDKFENIKVGDELLIENRNGEDIYEVDKVTNTRFICGGRTFLKKNGNQYGADAYTRNKASILSEEDYKRVKRKKERAKLSYMLNNTNFNSLSLETLQGIFKLIEND